MTLIWVGDFGYSEPLCDGEKVITVRHKSNGDLVDASGRTLLSDVSLDQAALAYFGETVRAKHVDYHG